MTPRRTTSRIWAFLRDLGPGLVLVLTWLGPGDVIETSVAGGTYGYSLVWALAVSIAARFVLAQIIAKYHLGNRWAADGESVVDGLHRLSRFFPFVLGGATFVLMHCYCAYMIVGLAEISRLLFGGGPAWLWAFAWAAPAAWIAVCVSFKTLKLVFEAFAVVLAASIVGIALSLGPDVPALVFGLAGLQAAPERAGAAFQKGLIVASMIGSVAGSLLNLVYPYTMAANGWTGPSFRRRQSIDLAVSVGFMFLLNLAVWIVGAELLFGSDIVVRTFSDLAAAVENRLGVVAGRVFLVGMLATVFDSLIGFALWLAMLATHCLAVVRGQSRADEHLSHRRTRTVFVLWAIASATVWTLPGMPGDFVSLTLLVNALAVFLLPAVSLGLWAITSRPSLMFPGWTNTWWEHLAMFVLTALSVWGAVNSFRGVVGFLT
ncbi:MAG: NRAMP family divalent metal transporter [Planctomycetia bacterium]